MRGLFVWWATLGEMGQIASPRLADPFLSIFQFETFCVSNHTACRFAEKTQFFRSLSAGLCCAAASHFAFFMGIRHSSTRLRAALRLGVGRRGISPAMRGEGGRFHAPEGAHERGGTSYLSCGRRGHIAPGGTMPRPQAYRQERRERLSLPGGYRFRISPAFFAEVR